MSSARLPGKVLMPIAGEVILKRVYDRVKLSTEISKIIVATSDESSDDAIEIFCKKHCMNFFRESLHNVAQRFMAVAKNEKVEEFLRISADSPLIDPRLISKACTIYRDGNYDLVTNILTRTFPKGQSIEVLRVNSFRERLKNTLDSESMEHVTRFYYRNPEQYSIANFAADDNFSSIQHSVDTSIDFQNIEHLLQLTNLEKNPSWIDYINYQNALKNDE